MLVQLTNEICLFHMKIWGGGGGGEDTLEEKKGSCHT